MIAYIGLALAPIVVELILPRINTDAKQRKQYFAIIGVLLLLFMGLRSKYLGSVDTQHYWNWMERALLSDSWNVYYRPDGIEMGFQLFVFCLSRILPHPQWLLVITALFYIVSVFYFVAHNSKDIALSITIYITLGLMSFHLQGMRQSIAMCICLYAYEQAKRGNIVRFLLLVLLATTFHQTAIIFIPVYILCRMDFSYKKMPLLCAAAVIVLTSANKIVNIANAYFDMSYADPKDGGGVVSVLIYVIILITTLLYDTELKTGNAQTPLLFILFCGFVSFLMRYFGTNLADRISFYFVFSQLVLLPNAANMVVPKQRRLMRGIIAVLSIALMVYRLTGTEFIPYRFMWTLQ